MSAFVVPPTPKNAKIPVITLEELANALRAYIQASYPFSYIGEDMDSNARDRDTNIFFYGNSTAEPPRRMKLVVSLYGKAARSWQSKLYNMPFDIIIYDDHDDFARLMNLDARESSEIRAERTRYLMIEPLADRSISIRQILRWENGRPVLEV